VVFIEGEGEEGVNLILDPQTGLIIRELGVSDMTAWAADVEEGVFWQPCQTS
jgi:hypothetical protein